MVRIYDLEKTKINNPDRLTCLVIEDEALAVEMMEDYIGRRSDLELVGVIHELSEARYILAKQTPSIIFLDLIIPPGISQGFHFGELPRSSSIIIISAIPLNLYRGILPAGDIFELPKPVSFENFDRCIDMVLAKRLKN